MNKMNELCEMELTGRYEEKLSALKAEISTADEYIRQDNSDLTKEAADYSGDSQDIRNRQG